MIHLNEFDNNFTGTNMVFCENINEKRDFIKTIYNKYNKYNIIVYKSKSKLFKNERNIIVDNAKRIKYKNSIIFMDLELYLKEHNGLSKNNINKFKTPVFILSQKKLHFDNDMLLNSDRVIISGKVLKRLKLSINKYKYSDLAYLTDNFNDWIIYDYKKDDLYLYELDNSVILNDIFISVDSKFANNILNENSYLEYSLDNPIIYENYENQHELWVGF